MAYNNGPRIVDNGLILCLDAGNPKSYLGSGTAWNDLSGNDNNATLINTPAFDSGNKGSIVFDSTDDAIDLGTSTIFDGSSGAYSYQFWVYPTDLSVTSSLVTRYTTVGYGISIGGYVTNGIGINTRNTSSYGAYIGNCLNQNAWQNIALSFYIWSANTAYTLVDAYVNGKLVFQDVGGYKTPSLSTNLYLGNTSAFNVALKGKMSNCLYYNRTISANEVLQNYNATKGRFLTS